MDYSPHRRNRSNLRAPRQLRLDRGCKCSRPLTSVSLADKYSVPQVPQLTRGKATLPQWVHLSCWWKASAPKGHWGESRAVPERPEQRTLEHAQSPGCVRWKKCPRRGRNDCPHSSRVRRAASRNAIRSAASISVSPRPLTAECNADSVLGPSPKSERSSVAALRASS